MQNNQNYNQRAAKELGWLSPSDKFLSYFYEAPFEPKKAFIYGLGFIVLSIFAAPNVSFIYAVAMVVSVYLLSTLLNKLVRNRRDVLSTILKIISAIGFIVSIGMVVSFSFYMFGAGFQKILEYFFHIDRSLFPYVFAVLLVVTSIIAKLIWTKRKQNNQNQGGRNEPKPTTNAPSIITSKSPTTTSSTTSKIQ